MGETFAELVPKAKNGDRCALNKLMTETAELLAPMARQFAARSKGIEADDLLQNGLSRLFQLLERYDQTKQSWTTFAAIRFTYACHDFGRQRINRPTCNYRSRTGSNHVQSRSFETEIDGKAFETKGYIDESFDQVDNDEEFERLIAGLSRDEKNVVRLRYIDALTMREIGAVLRVSESRVSQLHSAAVQRLAMIHEEN